MASELTFREQAVLAALPTLLERSFVTYPMIDDNGRGLIVAGQTLSLVRVLEDKLTERR